MRLRIALVVLLLTSIPAAWGAPRRVAPAGLAVTPVSSTVIRTLDRFELRLSTPAPADPFDPDKVLVQGHFLSPTGQLTHVDGFWFQDFRRGEQGGREVLTPRGAPEWRIRFTPVEVGTWAYTVTIRDARGTRATAQRTFRAVRPLPDDQGFIRAAGRYFAHASGVPFFPVGENLAWSGAAGTYAYDLWLRRLGREKATYARVWAGPFDRFTVERRAGRYDLEAAWRLDYVLRLAELTGLRIAFVADSFNSLRIRPGPALWGSNPYNRRNRGFLERPEAFFTDARARVLFKNRLRYMAARYGYSPATFSWELMNEVDLTEGFSVTPVRDWAVDVARALRGFDPYAHPITISFGGSEGEPSIDTLPEIDYVQTHVYGAGDLAQALAWMCREKARLYGKPNLVGETGPSVHRATTERDDLGIWVHDALWAPVFAGGAGTGMPWWWDSYVDARDRYPEFGAVERFTRGVPWTATAWRPLEVLSFRYAEAPKLVRNDVIIAPPQAGWQKTPYNRPVTVEVLTDGTVRGIEKLSRILHGASRDDLHNPATFLVDYPVEGTFVVHVVDPPSRGSQLRVEVDGKARVDEAFDSGERSTPLAFPVPLTAGQHVVRVSNSGSGFIDVDYELPGYRRTPVPNLRVSGLTSGRYAVVWVENRDHTWLRRALRKAVRPVPPTVVVLKGFDIGDYVVEEWNTETGTSIPWRERCIDGYITLRVPTLPGDVAYRIHPPERR